MNRVIERLYRSVLLIYPEDFRARFGLNLHEVYGEAIKESVALGLLKTSGRWPDATVRLTQRGKLLANEAFVRFLGD